MGYPESPHLAVGSGVHVGIITLWTKKEHVLKHVPKELYAVASQLYSRDEGISQLLRSLLEHKEIRHLVLTGADLNKCAETLLALWNNGAENGQVKGASGYVDTEIPAKAIDAVRKHVELHDKRSEKDYARLAEYIRELSDTGSWGEPERYPKARITPPARFPTAESHSMRHESIKDAAVDLAHRAKRFGTLHNVHLHLQERSKLPEGLEQYADSYTEHLLGEEQGTYGAALHRNGRLEKLVKHVIETGEGVLHLASDHPVLDLIELFSAGEQLHLFAHLAHTTIEDATLVSWALFSLLDELAAELHRATGTVTVGISVLDPAPKHLVESLASQARTLRRSGDPRSNILIRLKEGRIHVTHLSPEGKRLEEFNGENARELYKRLVVEHRITDLSHAAYLGYELARAEAALKSGGMYEQDAS